MQDRNDWNIVYQNQRRLLKAISFVENVFLAGGTAIQCYTLSKKYRESEDLDFFAEYELTSSECARINRHLIEKIRTIDGIEVDYIKTEDGTYRITCEFPDNDEIIKVEFLNFTAGRFFDKDFVEHIDYPRIENNYNLLLYKLKTLCDRTDTIKDLFDIYFLFKELCTVNIKQILSDLKLKFEEPTGYIYDEKHILRAMKISNRNWDIIPTAVTKEYWFAIQEAIEIFRNDFIISLISPNISVFDFSYETYVEQKATEFECSKEEYIQLFETNKFIEAQVKEFVFKT